MSVLRASLAEGKMLVGRVYGLLTAFACTPHASLLSLLAPPQSFCPLCMHFVLFPFLDSMVLSMTFPPLSLDSMLDLLGSRIAQLERMLMEKLGGGAEKAEIKQQPEEPSSATEQTLAQVPPSSATGAIDAATVCTVAALSVGFLHLLSCRLCFKLYFRLCRVVSRLCRSPPDGYLQYQESAAVHAHSQQYLRLISNDGPFCHLQVHLASFPKGATRRELRSYVASLGRRGGYDSEDDDPRIDQLVQAALHFSPGNMGAKTICQFHYGTAPRLVPYGIMHSCLITFHLRSAGVFTEMRGVGDAEPVWCLYALAALPQMLQRAAAAEAP